MSAERRDQGLPYHFGRCPWCHGLPIHRPIAAPGSWKLNNIMACDACRVYWCVGYGLMSWGWEDREPPHTPEEAGIAGYLNVDGEEHDGWARWAPTDPHSRAALELLEQVACEAQSAVYREQWAKAEAEKEAEFSTGAPAEDDALPF